MFFIYMAPVVRELKAIRVLKEFRVLKGFQVLVVAANREFKVPEVILVFRDPKGNRGSVLKEFKDQ
jgi:hypothetical protein